MDTNTQEIPQLLTLQEAADRLSISKRSLEREIQRGNFPPPLKIGRATRVEVADLVRYVEGLRQSQDTKA